VKHRLLKFVIAGLSIAAVIGGPVIGISGGSGIVQSAGADSPMHVPPLTTTSSQVSRPVSKPTATTTVRTAKARVGGAVEAILINAKGLPLYTYKPDTTTQSMVTGQLAALWPPLVGSAPRASGARGSLAVVQTRNGRQVTYNGHFLYTFVDDAPGRVTGQGVSNFFVATPRLKSITVAAKTAAPMPASGGRYSY
jgi:predicted lipoprotein with Yx(FWY)xxD motif